MTDESNGHTATGETDNRSNDCTSGYPVKLHPSPHQPEVLVRPKQSRMSYTLGDSGGFRHNALGSHFYHQRAFSLFQWGMAALISTVI